jgi:hypothetical protein
VNPEKFAISDGISKKFQADIMFISFYSIFSRSISVTVSFAGPPKPRHVREQEKLERQMALANNTLPNTPGDGLFDTRTSTAGSPSRVETANDSQRPIKKPEKKLDPYTQMLKE